MSAVNLALAVGGITAYYMNQNQRNPCKLTLDEWRKMEVSERRGINNTWRRQEARADRVHLTPKDFHSDPVHAEVPKEEVPQSAVAPAPVVPEVHFKLDEAHGGPKQLHLGKDWMNDYHPYSNIAFTPAEYKAMAAGQEVSKPGFKYPFAIM